MNFTFVVFVLCVLSCYIRGQNEGDFCKDEKGQDGKCKLLIQCNQAIENIRNNIFPKICQFQGTNVTICCSETLVTISNNMSHTSYPDNVKNVTNVVNDLEEPRKSPGEISRAKCTEYSKYSYRKVVSPILSSKPQYHYVYDCQEQSEAFIPTGVFASSKEFPHMAHVGFELDNITEYWCGGSLISENFVLTAGHCSNTRERGPPTIVRFGVINVDDTEHRQERKIIEIRAHPDYKFTKKYHDIALLKLEKPVDFTSYVRPACLNSEKNFKYTRGVVPGWTHYFIYHEPSKDLMKSIVNIFPNEACNKIYSESDKFLDQGIVEDWMICAGIISDQRKNVCRGGSGSPLVASVKEPKKLQCMHSILGVTSFGKSCWPEFSPGVYTRVSAYINWIEKTVWPQETSQ